MTLIHMAPQVPLPDRLNQARVQLVEVKYMPGPKFELHSKVILENNFKFRHIACVLKTVLFLEPYQLQDPTISSFLQRLRTSPK